MQASVTPVGRLYYSAGRERCSFERRAMNSILVSDSITKLGAEAKGAVAVAASHGGVYPANLAAQLDLRGVILNDAGIGLDHAGIACLSYLEAIGMAAATVGHDTARIGDGSDMMARGTISHVNPAAARLGCAAGQSCADAAMLMRNGAPPTGTPPAHVEGRVLLRQQPGLPPVWGLDSNSLVRTSDAGAIVVTGSHGGLLGGRPESAVGVQVLAAVYNDAGIGIDRAGISRLAALDARAIAAVTVSAATARIGDARSAWTTGVISAVNDCAARIGGAVGMRVPDFVDRVLAHRTAPASDVVS
jgi:hypothetical protein